MGCSLALCLPPFVRIVLMHCGVRNDTDQCQNSSTSKCTTLTMDNVWTALVFSPRDSADCLFMMFVRSYRWKMQRPRLRCGHWHRTGHPLCFSQHHRRHRPCPGVFLSGCMLAHQASGPPVTRFLGKWPVRITVRVLLVLVDLLAIALTSTRTTGLMRWLSYALITTSSV